MLRPYNFSFPSPKRASADILSAAGAKDLWLLATARQRPYSLRPPPTEMRYAPRPHPLHPPRRRTRLPGCPAPEGHERRSQTGDRRRRRQVAQLTAAGHADSLADLYHVNGVMLPPNMPPVRGRDAIRGFMTMMNSMSSPPPVLTVRADSVWAQGASALELGRWNFAWAAGAKRPPGAPAADSGKYMVRWVQEDGRWLMVQDIWNSDVAMPMAPAMPNTKK